MFRWRTVWYHIRRSPYQALLAISITSLTFFVFGLVIYTALVTSSLLRHFEQKPQITAFFSDEKSEDSIGQLKEKLKATGQLASLRYVSKEEALKIYQEQNKDDPLLLEMVTAEILPASLEVQAQNPRFLAEIAKILEDEPEIDEIIYQKDIVDTLLTWTVTIRRAGVVLIIFFSLLTILVTLTITGMKIILRKEEIEILKLVGATRSYISTPFMVEAALYGIVGAIIGWFFSWAVLLYSTPFLSSLFVGMPPLAISLKIGELISAANVSLLVWPVSWLLMTTILGVLILIGAFLGVLGSLAALWRYVKL